MTSEDSAIFTADEIMAVIRVAGDVATAKAGGDTPEAVRVAIGLLVNAVVAGIVIANQLPHSMRHDMIKSFADVVTEYRRRAMEAN